MRIAMWPISGSGGCQELRQHIMQLLAPFVLALVVFMPTRFSNYGGIQSLLAGRRALCGQTRSCRPLRRCGMCCHQPISSSAPSLPHGRSLADTVSVTRSCPTMHVKHTVSLQRGCWPPCRHARARAAHIRLLAHGRARPWPGAATSGPSILTVSASTSVHLLSTHPFTPTLRSCACPAQSGDKQAPAVVVTNSP
ncbi:hypothetical protein FA95DRAFT_1019649 [Auriscalpium vulgare]|uniref:Uncharacterized protein n=1 Tax=Auriscalpium vulgare TaxID=40419 RepID=A0ACB8R7D3_9AGAM|nr:hypothetical protein FA95DRAFT_1019649 [Auriscalpium vulgare]